MKKIISIVLSFMLMICGSTVIAAEDNIDYDHVLISHGFPQERLYELTENQKAMICSTLEVGYEFSSCVSNSYYIPDDDSVVNSNNDRATIPDSDLTISVVSFYNSNTQEYYVYPSFDWNVLANISQDVFGYAFFSGWEVVAGQENLRLYIRNQQGNTVGYVDEDPIQASYSGYAYGWDDIFPMTGSYEAHAYVHVKDTTGNSTHSLSYNYTHVTTSSSVSFSISIGPASITINCSSNNSAYMAANIPF